MSSFRPDRDPHILDPESKELTRTLVLAQVNDNGMACELAMGFAAEKACPVFRVSNVTGEGLELLKVGHHCSSGHLPCP